MTDGTRDATPEDDDPAADPDAVDGPVLVFDGVCNLCNGAVRFVIERDPDGEISFAPLQSRVARELLIEAGIDPARRDTVVLLADGEAYTKSEAAIRVAERLGGVYELAGAGRVVPRVVRDWLYDRVAASRYDVFGRRDRCMVPSPDVQDRFLATSGGGA